MTAFPVPQDEAARLQALEELHVLDTPPEQAFDDVVKLAAAICRTPIASINLIDRDRQWTKALVGGGTPEVPREASFCARTIVSDDGVLVVPDALADPVFATNPYVTGDPHLRFYAGAQIIAGGHAVGSLCVADHAPRELDPAALEALTILARQVAAHLQLRVVARRLQEANTQLRQMAIRDPLTGLANRTLLFDRLEHALRSRPRPGRSTLVLYADLDGFKAINDRLGHQAGDDVLREVAARLAGSARAGDTVARMAGDEFVVVCPDVHGPADLPVIAGRLTAAVRQPMRIAGGDLVVGISIGGTTAQEGEEADAVVARADAAMYAVKRAAGDAPVGT